jgi:hypothetical protein
MRFITRKRQVFFTACLGLTMSVGAQHAFAAPAATVGWTRTTTGKPIPGWMTTVTNTVAGPPLWGYRIVSGPLTASVDRIVIDLAVPCDAPKSSFAPIITPAKGLSQHYILIYRKPSKIQTISLRCDARHGINTTKFEMMRVTIGTTKVLARSATAVVDGPR